MPNKPSPDRRVPDEKVSSDKNSGKQSGFVNEHLYQMISPLDYYSKPFEVDGQLVEVLKIRKLKPAELMGINISALGEGNMDAVVEMLQRCCTPALSFEDVNNLDLPFILEATGVFKTFFMGTQSVMSES